MYLMSTGPLFMNPGPVSFLPYSSENEEHCQGLCDHNFHLIYTTLFSFPSGTWPYVRIQLAEKKPVVNVNLHGVGQKDLKVLCWPERFGRYLSLLNKLHGLGSKHSLKLYFTYKRGQLSRFGGHW